MLGESTPVAAESDESLPSVPMAPFSSKCQNHSRVAERAHSRLRTPWSTGLLEMLTGSQLVKKFPAF
jgi:hypothetical protein